VLQIRPCSGDARGSPAPENAQNSEPSQVTSDISERLVTLNRGVRQIAALADRYLELAY
jgi:hypothetical protein